MDLPAIPVAGSTPFVVSRTGRRAALLLTLALALVVRAQYVFTQKWDSPNGDEAVAGLMAKHIAEGRSYPIFFYGQSYFGALEPYLNALGFAAFGFHPNLIWVLPTLFGVVSVFALYRLASKFFGFDVGVGAALLMAVPQATLLANAGNAGGGFSLALLLQLVALYCFMYLRETTVPRKGPALLAFSSVSGLLFWVWQLYIPLFGLLIIILMSSSLRLRMRWLLPSACSFLIAAAPLWIFNFEHSGATFFEAFGKYAAADTNSDVLQLVRSSVGNRIWNLDSYVSMWLTTLGGGNPALLLLVSLGVAVAVLAKLPWSRARLWFPPNLSRDVLLLVSGLAFIFCHRNSRYLDIVALLLLVCGVAALRQIMRPNTFCVSLSLILVGNIIGARTMLASTDLTYGADVGALQRGQFLVVTRGLHERGLTSGYSDFWNAYPISYLSDEATIVSPLLTCNDRYPAYTQATMASSEVFVYVPGQSSDVNLIEEARRLRASDPALIVQTLGAGTLIYPLPKGHALRQNIEARSVGCLSAPVASETKP